MKENRAVVIWISRKIYSFSMILGGVSVQKKELHCYVAIHQAYLKGQNPHEKGILLKELQNTTMANFVFFTLKQG